jgi:hypothetical protein
MSDSEVLARVNLPRSRNRAWSELGFRERRRTPRPLLAEIRRGANLNLLPPIVVTSAVRMVEFLLVAALGFEPFTLAMSSAKGRAPISSISRRC